jgi:hypothetical protein
MSTIHIRRTLDSETLSLPELRPLVGKRVDIILLVNEDVPQVTPPTTKDWAEVERAAEALRASGYDFDAWWEQREYDRKVAAGEL